MNRAIRIIVSMFLLSLMMLTGCVDMFQVEHENMITYETHPTSISYHLRYGYQIMTQGTGSFTIHYLEGLPQILIGTISNITIHNQSHSSVRTINDNEIIEWNGTFHDSKHLFFEVSADVVSKTYYIDDLDGIHSVTREELNQAHPEIVNQFCGVQKNETKTLINPQDPLIKQTATNVEESLEDPTVFDLAKELFIWLKSNTDYQFHNADQRIQSGTETFQKKTGDCDDLSFLYISLCRAVNVPARFIRGFLIATQNNIQTIIPHVWAEVYVGPLYGNNGWIPVECSGTGDITAEVHQNFGVEDAHHVRLYTDNGSNRSMVQYTNQISVKYNPGVTIDIQNQAILDSYNVVDSQKLCITDHVYRTYCT